MELNELNKILFGSKISREGMERMNDLGLLPELCNIKGWKNTFCGRFICKYPKYYGIITKIQKLLGHIPEWEDFTKANIDDILSLFSSCSPSSARTYTAMLKAVLNDGKDEIVLPYPKFAERLNVKGTPSVNVYLDLDELSRLEQYSPKNEKENIVLAQFLIGCYTGARHSDILEMTEENIQGGYITYVSKKTNIAATIEAKPILKKLLPIAGKRKYVDAYFNDTGYLPKMRY